MSQQSNVSSSLIKRLYDHGVRHIFGVPGDFVLGFYQQLIQSNKLKVVNTCDEQGAAFAADAYARVNGLGVVCVTYCVGGLKVFNATAQAFAEKSPIVVISGAPGIKAIYNSRLQKHQSWELSNRWVRRALEAIKEYQTLTLVVKRRGSGMQDTEYVFLPVK